MKGRDPLHTCASEAEAGAQTLVTKEGRSPTHSEGIRRAVPKNIQWTDSDDKENEAFLFLTACPRCGFGINARSLFYLYPLTHIDKMLELNV